jgi:SET domain-containing protein
VLDVGNIARFIRHSSEPNLDVYQVLQRHRPLVPRIAFFTNRAIHQGEELRFDYGADYSETDGRRVFQG